MIVKSARAFLTDEGTIDFYSVEFDVSGQIETREVQVDPFNRHYAALRLWLDEGNELLPTPGQ